MERYPLPSDWVWTTLGQKVEIGSEQILPSSWPDREFNYLALENIEPGTARITSFAPTRGSEIRSTKFKFTEKHVLYGKLRPYLRRRSRPILKALQPPTCCR